MVFKKGNKRSLAEKPLLTYDQKKKRLNWVNEHWENLTDPSYPVAFLDKKWFYTTTHWRKMKKLPRGPTEINAPDALWKRRIINRAA